MFEEQKQRILKELPFVAVEHIGGTAVQGLLTKGDLDINVRVKGTDFDKAVEKLTEMYRINQPDNWTKTYASFKDDENLDIDLGVQLTVFDSPDDYFVKQRDALIQNPELVKELNAIKERCELEELSMNEYRKKKEKFFQKLLRKQPNSSSHDTH